MARALTALPGNEDDDDDDDAPPPPPPPPLLLLLCPSKSRSAATSPPTAAKATRAAAHATALGILGGLLTAAAGHKLAKEVLRGTVGSEHEDLAAHAAASAPRARGRGLARRVGPTDEKRLASGMAHIKKAEQLAVLGQRRKHPLRRPTRSCLRRS